MNPLALPLALQAFANGNIPCQKTLLRAKYQVTCKSTNCGVLAALSHAPLCHTLSRWCLRLRATNTAPTPRVFLSPCGAPTCNLREKIGSGRPQEGARSLCALRYSRPPHWRAYFVFFSQRVSEAFIQQSDCCRSMPTRNHKHETQAQIK